MTFYLNFKKIISSITAHTIIIFYRINSVQYKGVRVNNYCIAVFLLQSISNIPFSNHRLENKWYIFYINRNIKYELSFYVICLKPQFHKLERTKVSFKLYSQAGNPIVFTIFKVTLLLNTHTTSTHFICLFWNLYTFFIPHPFLDQALNYTKGTPISKEVASHPALYFFFFFIYRYKEGARFTRVD